MGIDLAETILLPPKAKDKKNRGLTKFLRQTFSTEEKFHLNHLSELINKSGFEVPRSTLKYNYLNSLLKEVVVEVSPDVYQLKSGYDKIHNREETITQSA